MKSMCVAGAVAVLGALTMICSSSGESKFYNDFPVPMRDGVKLAADIYIPTNLPSAKVGCHLVFSPYRATKSDKPSNVGIAEEWGVVTMTCDCRGLCHSQGVFDAWDPQLTDDAYDLLDWIVKQPWSNGKVVMVGGSYPGFTTLAAVRSGHPALVACSASVVTLDPYPINFQNGVLIPYFFKGWHSGLAGKAKWEEMTRHTSPSDPYWKARADLRDIGKSRARVYYQGGWYDMLGIDSFGTFNNLPKGSVMRMGPWNHGVNEFNGDGPAYDKFGGIVDDKPETELMRSLLEGRPSEIDKNPGRILIYVQGRNIWRYENEWPLKRQKLMRHVFANEKKSFRHDPKNPVRQNGGRLIGGNKGEVGGQTDQRKTEAREDVISFDSDVLADDLEVTGDVSAELVVSSTATNSDVYVKLVDVCPDGVARHVIEAVARSDFKPGEAKTLKFFMDITSHAFLKGHKIRVDVYGSCVPHYELNQIPAEITVHKGSALILPTIPNSGEVAKSEMVDHAIPVRTTRFPGANYSALAVSNGLAVTCSHWSREDCGAVFDISCPTNVKFLMRYPCMGYSCGNPVFFGTRCYVPNNFSISVLNLKDRKNPRYEGVINPQFPNDGGNELWVADGSLYFRGGKNVYKVRPDGLTFDKVDGVKPLKQASTQTVTDERGITVSIKGGSALTVDGHETPFAYCLSSIAVDVGQAWVYAPAPGKDAALLPISTGSRGLRQFGTRVPASPLKNGCGYQTMGMQTASSVTRVGKLLFADDGIAVITNRCEAKFIRPRTRAASDMSVDGKRIAIAQCAYCRVLDFADLNNIKVTDFAPPAENPLHLTGCVLEGKRLYVCYTTKESPRMDFIYQQPKRGFVASFDTDNPAKPLSVVEISACIAMAKTGNFLYVTGRDGDFTVVDATDSAALKVAEVRKDLQLGAAYKIKRFPQGMFLLTGKCVVELDVTNPSHPVAKKVFDRGRGTAAPGYDDFTVDNGCLFALAHASIDTYVVNGAKIDPIPNTLGVNGIEKPLEKVDAAIFAGHVANTARPLPRNFQPGRFGNSYGAYVYDWTQLKDGSYAVAYGEAGVVLCDYAGRFLRELGANPDDRWVSVFAKAVLEKDGDIYVQDAEGKAYRAFRNVFAGRQDMKGRWCSLGTSISWYNDNVAVAGGGFTRGFQDRVLEKLMFTGFENAGISGGTVGGQYVPNTKADWYTIEHGINDWGQKKPVGTMSDYTGNTKNKTFYANYRILIDKIREKNPSAKIVLCTPRKGYGFGSYLPKRCDLPKDGVYLKEYADAVRAIAAHEKLAVADFYATCGEQDELKSLSIDTALHPNDAGYQKMADELVKAFESVR